LRRNLATIIEARLKEIAEWVGREIKEANCGAKFSPILLLTGGGSEMQNIEKLFSRELGIDDVRAVYPEFGFTENMTDIITTMAYSTVASLLLFGAQHGVCSVAGGVRTTPSVEPPVKPQPATIHVAEPEPAKEETHQEKKAEPQKISVKAETEDPDKEFEVGTPTQKKSSFWERLQREIGNIGNSFAGKDEDKDNW
jgi:cell division protein FtsA